MLALFLVAAALLYASISRYRSQLLPFPPGPPTTWFGRVPEIPKTYQWLTYSSWKKIYGDVIYIRVFGNPIIVLNSISAAKELLVRRGNNYSSRTIRTMVTELMGWDWLFSGMPYGSSWRRHRSLFHQYYHTNIVSEYSSIQLRQTHILLQNLLQTPENCNEHVKRTAAAIVLDISYGHQVVEDGDAYVTLADNALSGISKAGIWGTYLVDYIPLLKYVPAWMPGARFKRQAREWRLLTRAMVERPFDMVKQQVSQGKANSCLVASELVKRMQSLSDYSEFEIKNVAAIAYAAGADTTVSAIMSFFLAATLYPEVQRKAREELDSVVGTSRLPHISDKGTLSYIDAIVWEALRWNPVAPLGLAHYVAEDDEYNGYCIPKGTTVLPNIWCMLHDEIAYPQPFEFCPDRFLVCDDTNTPPNPLPHIAFGFGRRACPGRWLAYDTIWITVASVLAAFELSKALDDNGRAITPLVEYTPGMLSHPKPFKFRIIPRSPAAIALIKQTADGTD